MLGGLQQHLGIVRRRHRDRHRRGARALELSRRRRARDGPGGRDPASACCSSRASDAAAQVRDGRRLDADDRRPPADTGRVAAPRSCASPGGCRADDRDRHRRARPVRRPAVAQVVLTTIVLTALIVPVAGRADRLRRPRVARPVRLRRRRCRRRWAALPARHPPPRRRGDRDIAGAAAWRSSSVCRRCDSAGCSSPSPRSGSRSPWRSWLFYQSWFVHIDAETGSSLQLPRPAVRDRLQRGEPLLLALPRRVADRDR